MNESKPLTTYLITALVLWAIFLWKQGRLGRPGLLPAPQKKQEVRQPQPGGGWKQGTPTPPGRQDQWSE